MDYRWVSDENPRLYGLKTTTTYSKVYNNQHAFFHELYFHNLIHGHGMKGFLPIVGYGALDLSNDKYTVFYTGQKIVNYFPITDSMFQDVIETIYWMARHGYYYITKPEDSLFWDSERRQIVLADYRFLDLNNRSVYPVNYYTDPPAKKQLTGGDIGLDSVSRTIARLFGDLDLPQLHSVPTRPLTPPPITIDQYIRDSTEDVKENYRNILVYQSVNPNEPYVQTPPVECLRGPTLTYPFIGKLAPENDDLIDELHSTLLMDFLDPAGKYHSRLAQRCISFRERDENIYEFTGQPLRSIDNELKMDNRVWFYRGVLNLLEGLKLLHSQQYVHGDLSPKNITWNPFLQLKMIDFGLSKPVDLYTVKTDVEWVYKFHPVELKLINDPTIDNQELFKGQETGRLIYSQDDYFRYTSKEDKFIEQYWNRLRELDPTNRRRVIAYNTDLYGVGRSLICSIPDELFDDILNELEPVIYHLITYVYDERSLDLAIEKARELITTVESEFA